jgi:membrane-bound inhibitor of C-type lysozyme
MIRRWFYPAQKNLVIWKYTGALSILFSMIFWGCVTQQPGAETALSVEIDEPVYYRSEAGEQFVARYGSLSDGSLHFVKVKMPDGNEYTLPQVVSGSGVRYTDEREIVWWTHQGTVRVDVRDAEGQWVTRYEDLREISKST